MIHWLSRRPAPAAGNFLQKFKRLLSEAEVLFSRRPRSWVGIDISRGGVRAVRLTRMKGRWRLAAWSEKDLPEDAIRYSYKNQNIIQPEVFGDTIKKVMGDIGGHEKLIGLALPNEVVKVTIQSFKDLPDRHRDIHKMLIWWVEKNLKLPAEKSAVAFHILGNGESRDKQVLMVVGCRDVIREYEIHLKALQKEAAVIQPAGICQLNFFSGEIPMRGVVGYLGYFKDFFVLGVVENGRLAFYQGVKTGPEDPRFIHHLDATLEQWAEMNPDRPIERLFMNYPGGSYWEIEEMLMKVAAVDTVVMDESRIIGIPRQMPDLRLTVYGGEMGTTAPVSAFTAAMGAAQSLMA